MSLIGQGLAVPLTLSYGGFVRGLGASRAALRTFERSTNTVLRRMSTNFRRLSYFMNPLRASFAAFATAIPVAALEKLNRALQKSYAVFGNVTEDQKKRMRQNAIDISKSTVFYASQAAEGYFDLASAGYKVEQAIGALPVVARFAQAGLFDLNEATTLLVDSQTALNMRSEDTATNLANLTRMSDALTMGNKISTATVQQMAEGLSNGLGGALRRANKGLEEGVALLTVFAERGIKGAAGGTAASIVLRDLQNKAVKYAAAFRAADIAVFDQTGQMRMLADIIGDMEKKMAGMSPAQRTAFLQQLHFQDRSIKYMLDLVGNSQRLRDNMEQIQRSAGITKQVSEDMITPLQKSWNEFKGAFQQFSESLKPVLDMLTALLSGAARSLDTQQAFGAGKNVADFIVKTVGQIGNGIQLMVGAVMDFIKGAMVLMDKFRMSEFAAKFGMGYDDASTFKGYRQVPSKNIFRRILAWPLTPTDMEPVWGPANAGGTDTHRAALGRIAGMGKTRAWWGGMPWFSDWLNGNIANLNAKPKGGFGSPLGVGALLFNWLHATAANRLPFASGSPPSIHDIMAGGTFNFPAVAHSLLGAPGALAGAARGIGGVLGGAPFRSSWAMAVAQATANRRYAAGQALPFFRGLGQGGTIAGGAASGLAGAIGSGVARGLGGLFAGNPGTATEAIRRTSYEKTLMGIGTDPLALARIRRQNHPLRFLAGGAAGAAPGFMSQMRALIPAGFMAGFGNTVEWFRKAYGMAAAGRLAGRTNPAGITAEDPLSREGNIQRVRALRGSETDKIAKEQLKTQKDQLQELKTIAQRGLVVLAQAGFGVPQPNQ